ncbi:MAG: hypothetical protein JSV86_07285 [Gemmatimonadota bacterium]|nr:MAG: hypothetical protein JSV86_07285 [Gemmatimonadota bacterium]
MHDTMDPMTCSCEECQSYRAHEERKAAALATRPVPPHEVRIAASRVEALRRALLFEEPLDGIWNPRGEQHFLLALAALETAQRHLVLAALEQTKEA